MPATLNMDYLLASNIVHGLPVPGEVDGPGRDVDVHDPVDDLALEIALVFVDDILLPRIVEFDEGKMALTFLTNGFIDCL